MIQGRGGTCLAHEPELALHIGKAFECQHHWGDLPVQLGVKGSVNGFHTTLAELRFDLVVRQGFAGDELEATTHGVPILVEICVTSRSQC